MTKNVKKYRGYMKIKRTIESCKTADQFETAQNMIRLFRGPASELIELCHLYKARTTSPPLRDWLGHVID